MGRCAEAVVTNTAWVQQLHQFVTAPAKVGVIRRCMECAGICDLTISSLLDMMPSSKTNSSLFNLNLMKQYDVIRERGQIHLKIDTGVKSLLRRRFGIVLFLIIEY